MNEPDATNSPGDPPPVPPPNLRKTEATPMPPIGQRVTEPAPQTTAAGDSEPAEASLGARVAGFAIDVVVAISISWALSIINWRLGQLGLLAYLVTRDALPFLDGQSIGKKAMKTRAVTDSGASLSGNWNNGLLRNLPFIFPPFALVELIILATRQDQPILRRLGDEWFHTKVIQVTPSTSTPPKA
jgi:uncharacterized RDD family membrane protein YckC